MFVVYACACACAFVPEMAQSYKGFLLLKEVGRVQRIRARWGLLVRVLLRVLGRVLVLVRGAVLDAGLLGGGQISNAI